MSRDGTEACFHGGAFFDAIGDEFDGLSRRHDIVNADVLDAWFPPSPRVLEALREYLPWLLATSPPTDCGGMARVIARARGVPERRVLPGAGSSALIFLAFTTWLERDSRVLLLDPTYGEYAHVLEHVVGCHVTRLQVLRDEAWRLDPSRLVAAAEEPFDLIVVVNPNSPTGQHVPARLSRAPCAGSRSPPACGSTRPTWSTWEERSPWSPRPRRAPTSSCASPCRRSTR